MTREEAIHRIREHMMIHCIGVYPHIKIGEALDMAISALREQEYKEPCDGCRFFADAREQDFGLYETVVFEFCPVCGRRLEEV